MAARALHGHVYKFLIFFLIVGLIKSQGFEGFGNNPYGKKCKSFKCSAGKKPVPAWPFKVKSSGCSGIGATGMAASLSQQDGNAGKYLEHCCDMRHACMQVCGTTKAKCETQFKKCTEKACDKQPFIPTPGGEPRECKGVIALKRVMAQLEGCEIYDQAQSQNCKCKKEDDVEDARSRFITKFYGKYAGGKEPDLDKLMEKHGRYKGSFAALVIKLARKYSKKVVKHVLDPRMERMNDLFRQFRDEEAARTADNPDDAPPSNADENVNADSPPGEGEGESDGSSDSSDGDKGEEDASDNPERKTNVESDDRAENENPKPRTNTQGRRYSSRDTEGEEEEVELVDDDGHSEL